MPDLKSGQDIHMSIRKTIQKEEEERNYVFTLQLEKYLINEKKQKKKIKIEFLDDKNKKPYNNCYDSKFIETVENQNIDHPNNVEM